MNGYFAPTHFLSPPPVQLRHAVPPARWPTAAQAARSRWFSPVDTGRLHLRERTWFPRWCRGPRRRTAPSRRTSSTGTDGSRRARRGRSSWRPLAFETSPADRCSASGTTGSFLDCSSSSTGSRTPAAVGAPGPLIVLQSRDAATLTARLIEREVIGSSRGDAMRVSFHAYNNGQDVEAVMDALRAEETRLARVDVSVEA